MTDLSTLVSQFNILKTQIFQVQSLPCQCCQLKNCIINGLVSFDRPIGLDEIDNVMRDIQPSPCTKCSQLAILMPQFQSLQQQVYDSINTTYDITPEQNPFNI